MTQWNAWHARLKADGLFRELPSITRGQAHSFTLQVASDVSGDAFVATIAASPDAAETALATYEVIVGAFAGGVTLVTFSLSASETDIGQDADLDGVTELVFEITHTPTGLSAYRCAAGSIYVSGAVA
ncbi:MAG: hypothetical protein AAF650_04925 [Pseudomonadota bacterium]